MIANSVCDNGQEWMTSVYPKKIKNKNLKEIVKRLSQEFNLFLVHPVGIIGDANTFEMVSLDSVTKVYEDGGIESIVSQVCREFKAIYKVEAYNRGWVVRGVLK